jgi:hypothetical protein
MPKADLDTTPAPKDPVEEGRRDALDWLGRWAPVGADSLFIEERRWRRLRFQRKGDPDRGRYALGRQRALADAYRREHGEDDYLARLAGRQRSSEWRPTAEEFFAHPELWPVRFSDGRTGAVVRRGGEARQVRSDDPDLPTMAAAGWEPD